MGDELISALCNCLFGLCTADCCKSCIECIGGCLSNIPSLITCNDCGCQNCDCIGQICSNVCSCESISKCLCDGNFLCNPDQCCLNFIDSNFCSNLSDSCLNACNFVSHLPNLSFWIQDWGLKCGDCLSNCIINLNCYPYYYSSYGLYDRNTSVLYREKRNKKIMRKNIDHNREEVIAPTMKEEVFPPNNIEIEEEPKPNALPCDNKISIIQNDLNRREMKNYEEKELTDKIEDKEFTEYDGNYSHFEIEELHKQKKKDQKSYDFSSGIDEKKDFN